jgi:hypothetical protein
MHLHLELFLSSDTMVDYLRFQEQAHEEELLEAKKVFECSITQFNAVRFTSDKVQLTNRGTTVLEMSPDIYDVMKMITNPHPDKV